MAKHPDHPDWYEVRFTRQALEDWANTIGAENPELPPGDEVVLWMAPEPCMHCGEMPQDQRVCAFEPEGITDEGLLFGKHICANCLEDDK